MHLTDVIPQNATQKLIKERVLILNPPEPIQESVRATFAVAAPFFQESLELKSRCSFPQDMGYRPIGGEYSQSSSFPDQLESFSLSARVPIPLSELPSANARVLYEQMSATFDILEPLAEALTIKFASELSHRQIDEKLYGTLRDWSRLQLNYSRPAEVSVPFVNAFHEDLNLLTINFANEPGLEVGITEDEVMEVMRMAGEAVVLPGEIAWLLSGGQIKPLYHRVRADPQIRERLALLFFADPDPRVCQPWIANEINRDVDIGARVRTNVHRFGLQGFMD
ncbi:MAG TPA: 2OG-Fe(II) oxygenase family protein [Pyrinomonadaceae bacterium]|jgi:isopenicillin N synthase-like dioxygenase